MTDLLEEAENCRRKAHAYVGLPEATFLLKLAQGFEQLAAASYSGRLTGSLTCRVGSRVRSDPKPAEEVE